MLQIAVTSINPGKKTAANENMRYYGAYDYSLQTKHKFNKTLPLSNFDEESTAKLFVLYAAIEKCHENPNGVVEALSAFDKDNKTDIELLSYFRTKFTIGANTYAYPALHRACDKGHLPTVKLITEMGVDLNWSNSYGESPIFVAASQNNLEIVQYLAGFSVVDLDEPEVHNTTPVGIAYNNWYKSKDDKSLGMLKFLITNNASIDILDNRLLTLRQAATSNGHGQLIDELEKLAAPRNIERELFAEKMSAESKEKRFAYIKEFEQLQISIKQAEVLENIEILKAEAERRQAKIKLKAERVAAKREEVEKAAIEAAEKAELAKARLKAKYEAEAPLREEARHC